MADLSAFIKSNKAAKSKADKVNLKVQQIITDPKTGQQTDQQTDPKSNQSKKSNIPMLSKISLVKNAIPQEIPNIKVFKHEEKKPVESESSDSDEDAELVICNRVNYTPDGDRVIYITRSGAFIDDYDNGGQIQNNFSKTDLAFSPSFVGSSTFAYKPFKNGEIALLTKYVSKQYLDNTSNDARKLNAFFVNDIRLGYDFRLKKLKKLSLGLLVNNVFNELYASNGYTFSYIVGGLTTENYYYPQAETNFLFSMNLKF